MHHTQKDNKNILDLLAQGRKVPEDFGPDVSKDIVSSAVDSVKRPYKETASILCRRHAALQSPIVKKNQRKNRSRFC